MSQDRNKIIDKIHKCLALGTSSEPHEAQAALRQAQKLIDKYQITEEELTGGSYSANDHSLAGLFRTIAELYAIVFYCRAVPDSKPTSVWEKLTDFIQKDKAKWQQEYSAYFRFEGDPYFTDMAATAYRYLMSECHAIQKAYFKAVDAKSLSIVIQHRCKEAFLSNWLDGVIYRLRQMAKQPEPQRTFTAEELEAVRIADRNPATKPIRTAAWMGYLLGDTATLYRPNQSPDDRKTKKNKKVQELKNQSAEESQLPYMEMKHA